MNLNRILFLLSLSLSLISCFEDKGNYDYKKLHKISVYTTSSVSLIVGERKGFTAQIETEPGYQGELACEWLINSKVVCEEGRYMFEAKEVGEYNGLLRVYDVETGETNSCQFRIVVKADYETGFLVLSESADGNSDLHLIRSAEIPGDWYNKKISDTIEYRQDYLNVYETAMMGERLKGKPVSLLEHYNIDENNTTYGEIAVGTIVNGIHNYTELNGITLKKETNIAQEFTNEETPVNFNPIKLVHTAWDTFLLNEDGAIYPRRLDMREAYHTGRFDKDVTLYGSARFSDLIYSYYVHSTAIFAIEKVKKPDGTISRDYIGILENKSASPDLNQMKLPFVSDDPELLKDFVNVKDEVVMSDSYRAREYDANYDEIGGKQIVILKNSQNQYILHYFETMYVYKKSIKVLKSKKINLTTEYGMNNIVDMFAFRNLNITHAYIASDKKILYFNNVTAEIGVFAEIESDVKIVAIAGQGRKTISESRAENDIAIAYDDGVVQIFQLKYKEYNNYFKLVYESEPKFGKIKDIIYKYGMASWYFN